MSGGNDKLERELESFLADDSRVAALYRRLPKDEPDAKLDAVILAQARASVSPRRARPRWLPAMSAAAAIVLAAGLAYRVGPQVWNERSAVSEKAEQRVAAPASVPQQAPADTPPQAALPDTPVPLPQTTASPSVLETQTVTGSAIRRVELEATQPAQADKLQSQKRKVEDQKTAASAMAKQSAQGQARAEDESARDRADRANQANAQAGASREQPPRMKALAAPPRLDAAPAPPSVEASPAAPAMLATPAPKPSPPEPNAFPSAANATYAPAAAARPAPASGAASAPVMRERASTAADIEVTLYPEHWITDIQQMLKDGHRDDAIRNLKEFRKKYPDYTLPDDLRDLK